MAGQVPLLLLLLALCFDAAIADLQWPGNLFVPRQTLKCSPIVAIPLRSPKVVDNCLLYHFADLQQPATHHVMYVKDGDRQRYQLRLVTLGVEGHLGGQDLSFLCFTKEFPPVHCIGGTQTVVLHVGEDNRLYEIDVVLSPAGYPPVESLATHRPSSGVAQLRFPRGIPLHAAGYLQVCQQTTPSAVCDQGLPAKAALLPSHPGALGVGQVVLTPSGFSARTEFVVDRANQLMASVVGDRRSYFNSAGSFVSEDQTCTESPARTFASKLHAYDAQFLDHVGTITVVAHAGHTQFKPQRVALWIGITFDLATVQAVVLFADVVTGAHRGMEVLEVASSPSRPSGLSYWYDTVTPTVPGVSVLEFAQRMANLGDPCAVLFHGWMHPNATRTCAPGLVLQGGLCRELSSRLAFHVAPDALAEAAHTPIRWAAPAVAALLALGVLAPALRKACSGAPLTPIGFRLPQRSPSAYQTFELP